MANAIAIIDMPSSSAASIQFKNFQTKTTRDKARVRVCSVSASATATNDPYRTLRIRPGPSKSEVKKAFRQLAIQYHPDVCRENNSVVQFHHVNEAYDIVMSQLREESTTIAMETYESYDKGTEDAEMEMNDSDLDL